MSKVAHPIADAYREEGRKRPEGGEKFVKAMDKRIEEIKERSVEEKKQGRLSYRAYLYYWSGITTQEEFDKKLDETISEYKEGNFFLQRIGRYREVDAPLTIVLSYQRQEWIKEYKIKTTPELILLDMALVSYFHFLRLNEAVNNIMSSIEWDFFALDPPKFELRDEWGKRPYGQRTDKGVAEEMAHRLNEVLQPLLDQYNRSFIRNLKALRDLKRGNIQLNIENVGQMNIGDKQINVDKKG